RRKGTLSPGALARATVARYAFAASSPCRSAHSFSSSLAVSFSAAAWPPVRFQISTVVSLLHEASRRPSRAQATAPTLPPCPTKWTARRPAAAPRAPPRPSPPATRQHPAVGREPQRQLIGLAFAGAAALLPGRQVEQQQFPVLAVPGNVLAIGRQRRTGQRRR